MNPPGPIRRPKLGRDMVFFPAAAFWAALVLPWSVFGMLGLLPAPAAWSTPWGHAQEMQFGFALAVVAGYQMAPTRMPALWLCFALWVGARLAHAGMPDSMFERGLHAALAAMLVASSAPRLLRAAKRWSNRALPLLLSAIALLSLTPAVFARNYPLHAREVGELTVLALATLMALMGGRIITPAASGQLRRQWMVARGARRPSAPQVEARTPDEFTFAGLQPRLEGAMLIAMALALSCTAVPALLPDRQTVLPDAERLALAAQLGLVRRIALAFAALLSLVRLLRWRVHACRARPDLWCLGIGHGWLVLGLACAAVLSVHDALHLITVGALGTLSLTIMAMNSLLKARLDPAQRVRGVPLLPLATGLIAAATLLRTVPWPALPAALAWTVAAACWSLAFGLLLLLFLMLWRLPAHVSSE